MAVEVVKGWFALAEVLCVDEHGNAQAMCVQLHCGTANAHIESTMSADEADQLAELLKSAAAEARRKLVE